MSINIMNKYIEITKKQISTYLKLVFEKQYNKRYNDIYTEKYINSRYYNFFNDNDENTTIRKIVLEELRKTQEYLISTDLQEKEIIEKIHIFFCYFLYFDDVVYCKDVKIKISQIAKLRKKILNKECEEFEENLYREMITLNDEKEKLLSNFDTDEFSLKIKNYKTVKNIYRVILKQNIKFPIEYSELAVNKVFNVGIINEDKLIIEYYLITVQIIKDIIRQNFKKQYIVEFAETLLSKPKKILGILNVIDNSAIQDKISLKVIYEYYLENKEKIYELMREPHRFAIILDNSFEVDYKNMENLKMFKYVLLNRESKHYSKIMKLNEDVNNNIIEI